MSEKSKKLFDSVSSVKTSRVRRTFTAQFKEETLAIISREGMSVAEAARRLGVHASQVAPQVLSEYDRLEPSAHHCTEPREPGL